MFNEGPPRFRGPRFDERNWERPDDEFENEGPPPSHRQGRRSRWGNDESDEQVPGQEIEYAKGSTTPVYDEYHAEGGATTERDDGYEGNEDFESKAEPTNTEAVDEHYHESEEKFNDNAAEICETAREGDGGSYQEEGVNYQEEGNTLNETADNFQSAGDEGNFQEVTNNFQETENYNDDCGNVNEPCGEIDQSSEAPQDTGGGGEETYTEQNAEEPSND